MALTINGKNVLGLAMGDNEFVAKDNAGIPNLIGQLIKFSTMPANTGQVYSWVGQNKSSKTDITNNFIAIGSNSILPASGWNGTNSTIYAETVIPANPNPPVSDPNYRSKPTLFLGVYYDDGGTDWKLSTNGSTRKLPEMVWVKYDEVKAYIDPQGASASGQ